LAELSGVAAPNISAYESGRRRASAAMRDRLFGAMTKPSERLRTHRTQVCELIAQHGAMAPRVFGSVARGTDRPSSDIDILVRVPPEAAWSFGALKPALERVLGTPVDLISEGGLKPKHDSILREAVPL
jgi:predicted nucleotidyltransferase